MTTLPDVPRSDPATYGFLSRLKMAWNDLTGRVVALESKQVTKITHDQIVDFTKAVLDVMGNGGIVAGPDNIQVTYNGVAGQIVVNGFHRHLSGDITDFTEAAQDAVAAALVSGANVTILYDDASNTITISASGGGGGGGPGPPFLSSDITDFNEAAQDAVAAALVAGSGISIAYNDAGNQITITALGGGGGGSGPTGYISAWDNNVTTANSAATNATNLNALINATSVAGGGTIWFDPPGEYQVNSTVILRSNVSIMMSPGAHINWTGAANGVIVASSITDVLVNCTLRLNINEGDSVGFTGVCFNLHSAQFCDIIVEGLGYNSGSVFAQVFADSTAGEHVHGGRNTVMNRFTFRHHGQCMYGLIISGIPTGFAGQAQGATDNEWRSIHFNDVVFRGIKINMWSDTNTFSGSTYMGVSGFGGIGVIINEGHVENFTCYNTHFEQLAIDTFGGGLSRTGVVLNECEGITCDQFFQGPCAENGDLVGTSCLSYQFRHQVTDSGHPPGASINQIVYRQKGIGTPTL